MTKKQRIQGSVTVFAVAILLLILSGCGSGGPGSFDGSDSSSPNFLYGDGNGSVSISWAAPTTNTDGSILNDLDGYKVYYGTSSRSYTKVVDVGNITSCQVAGLSSEEMYYFAITAYDIVGIESEYSDELIKVAELAEQ